MGSVDAKWKGGGEINLDCLSSVSPLLYSLFPLSHCFLCLSGAYSIASGYNIFFCVSVTCNRDGAKVSFQPVHQREMLI